MILYDLSNIDVKYNIFSWYLQLHAHTNSEVLVALWQAEA